jgi:hypothetical protein
MTKNENNIEIGVEFDKSHNTEVKIMVNIESIFNLCLAETNFRERRFANTIKIAGNEFIMIKQEKTMYYNMFRYAINDLSLFLSSKIENIKFPSVFNLEAKTYAKFNCEKNIDLFNLCTLIERYLILHICKAWYYKCQLIDIYNMYQAELEEIKDGLGKIFSSVHFRVPISDLNCGYGEI